MELFKGINQIKLPLLKVGPENVNVYIVEGTEGNLMIDTGWNTPEAFNTLAQEMKNSGFAMKDITHIAVTHIHPDHVGLAGKIAEIANSQIFMSETEYGLMDSRYSSPNGLLGQMTAFLKANGVPDWELKMLSEASSAIRSFVSPIKSANLVKAGDVISMPPFEFQVIITPGHSPGHLCLYEPNKKYLFTGDHVLAESLPNISYHLQSGDNPLGDYVEALSAMNEMDVRFVFPGHGSVFSGLGPKIDDIIRLHRDQIRGIQKVMGVEIKNGYDVARAIPWTAGDEAVPYDKLEPIERRLAVLNTLVHLQYMVADGKGKKMAEGEKTVYYSGE